MARSMEMGSKSLRMELYIRGIGLKTISGEKARIYGSMGSHTLVNGTIIDSMERAY